jgi:hypothetical protein
MAGQTTRKQAAAPAVERKARSRTVPMSKGATTYKEEQRVPKMRRWVFMVHKTGDMRQMPLHRIQEVIFSFLLCNRF